MDDRPSFRHGPDRRRLAVALLTPWGLITLAYSLPVAAGALLWGGLPADWLEPVALVWFYSFGFPALLSGPAWFLVGVWRLFRRRGYRRSWYGWAWLVLVYVNLCLFVPIIGH